VREVTHYELFSISTIDMLLAATHEFFDRYNQHPGCVRSIIGALHTPQNF
jgi:hypothetical protein